MPQQLRESLLRNLEMALGATAERELLEDIKENGAPPQFAGLHFSYYSRYSTKVRIL